MRFLGLLLLSAGAAWAGEYAVLASGARLHVDRHEIEGTQIRLYNGTGYIELPASHVKAFEPADDPPPPAPAIAATPAPAEAPPAPIPALSPQELADAAADKYGLP